MFYTLIKHGLLTNQRSPGPINIMKLYYRCDQIQNLFKFP